MRGTDIGNPTRIAEELGFEAVVEGDRGSGTVIVQPNACYEGTAIVRTSALLIFADILMGAIAYRLTMPRASLTLDLSIRITDDPPTDVLHFRAEVLRSGRSTTLGSVSFHDSGGRSFGHGYVTYLISPRPQDGIVTPPRNMIGGGHLRLEEPLLNRVGLMVPEPGTATLAIGEDLTNGPGSLQGGLIALLAEEAARTALRCQTVVGLDVRYLRAARIGPALATANLVGPAAAVATIVDIGADNRLVASALVTAGGRTKDGDGPVR